MGKKISRRQRLTTSFHKTAKPTSHLASLPIRVAAASISSSSRKDAAGAAAVQQHGGHAAGGLVKRERKEVPLPSQEGTKGLVQYALYVLSR